MRKLLIAVSSESLATILTKKLQRRYHIHSCSSGVEAISLIETVRPDALIIDLSLPRTAGLVVLQRTVYKPPTILAISNLITESVVQAAASLGVQRIVLVPCTIRHIIEHLDALMERAPSAET